MSYNMTTIDQYRTSAMRIQNHVNQAESGLVEIEARSRRSQHLLVAVLFLLLPHLVYSFLWWGETHHTLGCDYLRFQPQQQLMFMQSVRDGFFPLWVPSESGGVPFAYYFFSERYSPITWMMLAWEPVFQGHQLEILTHLRLFLLSMAGFFTYLVMRRVNLTALPAAFAGIIFIFNFRTLDTFRFANALDVIVWLPVLIYLLERIVTTPRLRFALLYALVQYLLLVPGHMQEVLYCLYFANLYLVVRMLMFVPKTNISGALRWLASRLACFGGGQALGFGLCAVMLIPIFQDSLPLWVVRNSGDPSFYQQWGLTWREGVYNLFYPWLGDVHSEFYSQQLVWILVVVAAMSLFRKQPQSPQPDSRMLIFFFIVLIVGILYSLGPRTPVSTTIDAVVPFLTKFRARGRVMSVGMFAMAGIAAFGINQVLHGIQARVKPASVLVIGFVVFFVAGLILAVGTAGGWIELSESRIVLPLLWNLSKHSPARILHDPSMVWTLAQAIIAVALVNLVVVIWCKYRRSSGVSLALALIVVGLVEVGVYHRRGTWIIEDRVASARSKQFKEVDTYHTRTFRQQPFFMYFHDPIPLFGPKQSLPPYQNATPGPVWRFLTQGGTPAWRIYYQNVPGHEIPRAYVTPGVRLVEGDDLSAIATMNPYHASIIDVTDPANAQARSDKSLVQLSQVTRPQEGSDVRSQFKTLNSDFEVEVYTFNRASFSVRTATGGLFSYSDAYAKGWQATIDDEPTPIYRSNHVFKAIVLPPGHHRVEFVYDPSSFRTGLLSSLASWCVVFALGASCLVTIPRHRILLAGLVLGLAAAGAGQAYSHLYEMAGREGRINYDPNQPRAVVPDYADAAG